MRVFADLHHYDLYNSLHLLFEERLGWELYRPIGLSWFTQGYWKIAEPYGNSEDTVRQYLDINKYNWDPYHNINGGTNNYEKDGIYYIYDPVHKFYHKAITLEKFKELGFDIVIASIPPHIESYKQLAQTKNAKFVFQMGNMFNADFSQIPNLMASTSAVSVPPTCHAVFYHQEFDLNVFKYTEPKPDLKITSFVHCLPNKQLYELYKLFLKEYDFKAYGASCPDGAITGIENIATILQDSMFGYHVKPGGDGFGYVIHNWFACGRPVIIAGNDYADKLAGSLLEDGVTCIDLDKHTFQENLALIRNASKPEVHKKMCENVYQRFKTLVNFDNEFEEKLKPFLDNLR